MSPDQVSRYRAKANVVVDAWQRTLGESPTRHALILAMAVAEFETRLGDAGGTWSGEHNWGAIHKRSLTSAESSILLAHGVYPTDDAALRTARGLLTSGANEALHIDRNRIGPYFVWCWAFASDVEAAGKYLSVLIKERPGVRAIIDTTSPTDLAAAMFASRYFEGTSKDPQENIHAYGAHVAEYAEQIEVALEGWPEAAPGAPPNAGNAPPRRSKAGWWIAGIALLGVGAVVLGRRS